METSNRYVGGLKYEDFLPLPLPANIDGQIEQNKKLDEQEARKLWNSLSKEEKENYFDALEEGRRSWYREKIPDYQQKARLFLRDNEGNFRKPTARDIDLEKKDRDFNAENRGRNLTSVKSQKKILDALTTEYRTYDNKVKKVLDNWATYDRATNTNYMDLGHWKLINELLDKEVDVDLVDFDDDNNTWEAQEREERKKFLFKGQGKKGAE